MTNIVHTYDTAGNFTIDSDADVTTVGTLKALSLQTNETSVVRFDTKDATRSGGVGTGTLNGTAAVSGGKLVLDAGGTAYWDMAAASNIPSGNTGTVRFKFTPNFSGSPLATQIPVELGNESNAINKVSIQVNGSGSLFYRVYSSAGTVLMSSAAAPGSPFVSGTEYEVELSWDASTGAVRLYLDGTSLIDTTATSGTRTDASATTIRSGDTLPAVSLVPEYKIRDLEIFDNVQHTADFTGEVPRVVKIYSTDNPEILSNSAAGMTEFLTFAAVETKTGSDELKYTIYDGSQDYYLVGSTLTASDGTYAQSNTLTEWDTVLDAGEIDINPDANIQLRVFLHSDTGLTTPTITSATMTYNFFQSQTELNLTALTGYVIRNGSVVSDAEVTVRNASQIVENGNSVFEEKKYITMTNGFYTFNLPQSNNFIVREKFRIPSGAIVNNEFYVRTGTGTSSSISTAKAAYDAL